MMRNYARIDSGIIVEFFETDGDITTMFNPELIWVDVTDVSPQPQANWTAVLEGDVWQFAAPAATPMTAEQARQQRNALLSATDWVVSRHRDQDAAGGSKSLTDAQYLQVLTYRQQLRDVPQHSGFPASIMWPSAPAGATSSVAVATS